MNRHRKQTDGPVRLLSVEAFGFTEEPIRGGQKHLKVAAGEISQRGEEG